MSLIHQGKRILRHVQGCRQPYTLILYCLSIRKRTLAVQNEPTFDLELPVRAHSLLGDHPRATKDRLAAQPGLARFQAREGLRVLGFDEALQLLLGKGVAVHRRVVRVKLIVGLKLGLLAFVSLCFREDAAETHVLPDA